MQTAIAEPRIETCTGAPRPHLLRMLLLVLGAVFGLLVLATAFGSSSASADDGHDGPSVGSLLGGVVSAVTDTVAEPVHHAGAAVSHAVAPVSHAAAPVAHPVAAVATRLPVAQPVADAANDLAENPASSLAGPIASVSDDIVQRLVDATPLAPVIGPRPVASVLDPVAQLLDGSVAVVGGPVLPGDVAWPLAPSATSAAQPVDATVATVTVTLPMRDTIVSGSALGGLFHPVPAAPDDELVSAASAGGAMATALVMFMAPALLVRRRSMRFERAAPGSPVYDTDSSPD